MPAKSPKKKADRPPWKTSWVKGEVKYVENRNNDGPPQQSRSSALGKGAKDCPHLLIRLVDVSEDPNGDKKLFDASTGKPDNTRELRVVFLDKYADAAKFIKQGNRLTLKGFAVDLIPKNDHDALAEFDVELIADGRIADPGRSLLWEYKHREDEDKFDVWRNAVTERWGPEISDSNVDKAIKGADEIDKRLENGMSKPNKRSAADGGGRALKSQRNADPVYTLLRDVKREGKNTLWSAYGIVADYSQPRQTKGTDSITTMTVFDKTRPAGLKFNLLLGQMRSPNVRKVGDIVRLHRFCVGEFQNQDQATADVSFNCALITQEERPKKAGDPKKADDVSRVETYGIYQSTGTTHRKLDDGKVTELRTFSREFFSDPSKYLPNAMDLLDSPAYVRRIESLNATDKYFDLSGQLIDLQESDQTKTQEYCYTLDIKDGTFLPDEQKPKLSKEVITRSHEHGELVAGSTIRIYVDKKQDAFINALKAAAPDAVHRWCWLKFKNLNFKCIKVVPGDKEETVLFMDCKTAFLRLPKHHFKVEEMLKRQESIIQEMPSGKGGAAGKAPAPKQAAKGGQSSKGAAVGAGAKVSGESTTEPLTRESAGAFTDIAKILEMTAVNPVKKFRVRVRIVAAGQKHEPEDVKQFVKWNKLRSRFSGSLSLFVEDGTGKLKVLLFEEDFENFFGMKVDEAEKNHKELNRLMKKILAPGTCLELYLKSFRPTIPVSSGVVFRVYNSRVKGAASLE
mmetsp:Transcript_19491/g.47788  ORF Transcript_19491/g.47788 Transcript_19491/m.47788 type:complete len:739 (+) Transcript_19491:55-2271(+)